MRWQESAKRGGRPPSNIRIDQRARTLATHRFLTYI